MGNVRVLQLTSGKEPFQNWLRALDAASRASIRVFIDRLALGGSRKNIKALGGQLFELKINRGPGFRVYFTELKGGIILLIYGGNKATQEKDIKMARKLWRAYVSKSILR